MQTLERLIKINAWYAFACGIFALMVAPMVVKEALLSMGLKPEHIYTNETFFVATTFVRSVGVLLLCFTFLVRMLLKSQFDLHNLRQYFTLLAVGALLWGGTLIFVVSTRSIWLNSCPPFWPMRVGRVISKRGLISKIQNGMLATCLYSEPGIR